MRDRGGDPATRLELQRRLARLTADERAALERLRAGQAVADAGLAAGVRRKLEVRSDLAAVAVLVRAEDTTG